MFFLFDKIIKYRNVDAIKEEPLCATSQYS
jgi:hypothetical protein